MPLKSTTGASIRTCTAGWKASTSRRGGADTFNCITLALTAEDLDRLEADVRAGHLPPTSGFFFGESDGSESEDDLMFIATARAAIAEGKTVFYDSWW
ncbi:hypothetical protein [Sphingobium sp. SA916]|uniref:hypothetical protein n=1 Tax=Sphingobium sp. SA916 TaxID=1851207 RepID=UPI001C0EE9FA|nr:hypothetical protein [Sphingobium sp. SA916]